ncbi:PadR family transcriptional regulator [Streptomyces roseifaciens]
MAGGDTAGHPQLSEGSVQLCVGTLYGVLDRLAKDELIELDREEVQQGGRLRPYYRLTSAGEQALTAEAQRMAVGTQAAVHRIAAGRDGCGLARPARREASRDHPPRTALPRPAAPAAVLPAHQDSFSPLAAY